MDFILSKEKYCDLMKLDGRNAVSLFLYLLYNADDEGSLTVGIRTISSELGIGLQSIRTLLKKMYLTHLLTHLLTHQGSIITICDIACYRAKKKRANTPANTPTNTPNNKKKNDIDERKKTFEYSLVPYVTDGRYSPELVRAFCDYWTEYNKSRTKMRWELEKTWETTKRLATWANKDKQIDRNSYLSQKKKEQDEVGNILKEFL